MADSLIKSLQTGLARLRQKRSPTLFIAGRGIARELPLYIIAEIGINHNGDMDIAKRLIDAAADAGCDAVKFQKRTVDVVYSADKLAGPRKVDRVVIESALKRGILDPEAVKRLQTSNYQDTRDGDLKWALEFTEAEYQELFAYAQAKGLAGFASPWDVGSVAVLERLGVPCYKIASASITDAELLRAVHATGKPVILSTGMSTYEEIDAAVGILGYDHGLVILHTVSTYPTDIKDINLRMIRKLRERYPRAWVGYSGHEPGTGVSVAACALGARVLERHLTLDKTMFGSDQAASIEPQELKTLVADVRAVEAAIGDGTKRVLEAEMPIRAKLRRK